MTLCPVAIAVGCKKCPVFRVCPMKGIIGDYKGEKVDRAQEAGTKRPSSQAKRKG